MCYVECNEPEFLEGSLEKEIERYEDEVRGYEGVSRADVLNIARHFAKWQREQICAFVNDQLIPAARENIEKRRAAGVDDTFHVGTRNAYAHIVKCIENGTIETDMKCKRIVHFPGDIKPADAPANLAIDEETFNRHYMCE